MEFSQKRKIAQKSSQRKRRRLREKAKEQAQAQLDTASQLKDITDLLRSLLAKAEKRGKNLFHDASGYKDVKDFTSSLEELKQYTALNKEEAEEVSTILSSLKRFIPNLLSGVIDSSSATERSHEILLLPSLVSLSNMDHRTTKEDIVKFFLPVSIKKVVSISIEVEEERSKIIKTKKAEILFNTQDDTYKAIAMSGRLMKVEKNPNRSRHVFILRQTNNLQTICVSGLKKFEDDVEIKKALDNHFRQYANTHIISYFVPNSGLGFAYVLIERSDDVALKRDLDKGSIIWGVDNEICIREAFMISHFLEAYGLDATKVVESVKSSQTNA